MSQIHITRRSRWSRRLPEYRTPLQSSRWALRTSPRPTNKLLNLRNKGLTRREWGKSIVVIIQSFRGIGLSGPTNCLRHLSDITVDSSISLHVLLDFALGWVYFGVGWSRSPYVVYSTVVFKLRATKTARGLVGPCSDFWPQRSTFNCEHYLI
jgi:hypothetical protein